MREERIHHACLSCLAFYRVFLLWFLFPVKYPVTTIPCRQDKWMRYWLKLKLQRNIKLLQLLFIKTLRYFFPPRVQVLSTFLQYEMLCMYSLNSVLSNFLCVSNWKQKQNFEEVTRGQSMTLAMLFLLHFLIHYIWASYFVV